MHPSDASLGRPGACAHGVTNSVAFLAIHLPSCVHKPAPHPATEIQVLRSTRLRVAAPLPPPDNTVPATGTSNEEAERLDVWPSGI